MISFHLSSKSTRTPVTQKALYPEFWGFRSSVLVPFPNVELPKVTVIQKPPYGPNIIYYGKNYLHKQSNAKIKKMTDRNRKSQCLYQLFLHVPESHVVGCRSQSSPPQDAQGKGQGH